MSNNKNNNTRNFIQQTLDNYPQIKTILKGLVYSLIPLIIFCAIINPIVSPVILTTLSSQWPFKLSIINLANINFSISYIKTYTITLPIVISTGLLYSAGFFGFVVRFLGIKKPLRPQNQETPSGQIDLSTHHCDTYTDNSHMKVKKTCCYLSTIKKELVNEYLDDMLPENPDDYKPEPIEVMAPPSSPDVSSLLQTPGNTIP